MTVVAVADADALAAVYALCRAIAARAVEESAELGKEGSITEAEEKPQADVAA